MTVVKQRLWSVELQAGPLSKHENILQLLTFTSSDLVTVHRQVSTHRGALPWWPWKQSRSWSMLTSWHGQSCCACQPSSLQLKSLTTQATPNWSKIRSFCTSCTSWPKEVKENSYWNQLQKFGPTTAYWATARILCKLQVLVPSLP